MEAEADTWTRDTSKLTRFKARSIVYFHAGKRDGVPVVRSIDADR